MEELNIQSKETVFESLKKEVPNLEVTIVDANNNSFTVADKNREHVEIAETAEEALSKLITKVKKK